MMAHEENGIGQRLAVLKMIHFPWAMLQDDLNTTLQNI